METGSEKIVAAKPRPPLEVTKVLPAFGFTIPKTVAEICSRGGSAAGYSAVSNYMSCPEKSRLNSLGVRPKPKLLPADDSGIPDEIEDARTWGSIIHALRATRLAYGQERALALIEELDLAALDKLKLKSIWLIYDSQFPLLAEPFKYLGVEVEVVSDIALPGDAPRLRSVIYDSVILIPDVSGNNALFSFECKSAKRSGQFSEYTGQFMTQTAFWNANPHLVEAYGPMKGVVIDAVIKTEVPKCERLGPRYIDSLMQRRALEYARLPESVHFPVGPDGAYPRMLHTCWGRFRPCEFIGGCHEDAWGDYERLNKETGKMEPIIP